MFISFEGIDGSGKTTQIKLLAELLKAKGLQSLILREPGGTTVSEQIRDILLSKKNLLNPLTELLLFESARSHLVHSVIRPALIDGTIVLTDRFYDSTTAYQGYGRQLPLDDVKTCNRIATNNLKPDITFYLELSLSEAQRRSEERSPDRIEASGNEFYQRTIDGFREIAKEEPDRFFIIDASGNINETFHKIINILNDKYPDLNLNYGI